MSNHTGPPAHVCAFLRWQVDDAFFRHGSQELQRSAAAALLHCARNGPATIQVSKAPALSLTTTDASFSALLCA